jgi:hypothetical protein
VIQEKSENKENNDHKRSKSHNTNNRNNVLINSPNRQLSRNQSDFGSESDDEEDIDKKMDDLQNK